MTLEISSTHLVQLTPEFPMYLKRPIVDNHPDPTHFTYHFFSDEETGMSVWTIGEHANITHSVGLQSFMEYYKDSIRESNKFEFDTAVAKACETFNLIMVDVKIFPETTYPLNAVL